jgi:hypothetical protein
MMTLTPANQNLDSAKMPTGEKFRANMTIGIIVTELCQFTDCIWYRLDLLHTAM